MSIFGIHAEETREQTDSIAEVFIAAIFILISAHTQESVAGFERIDDVVVIPGISARGSYRFRSRRNGLLRMAIRRGKQQPHQE